MDTVGNFQFCNTSLKFFHGKRVQSFHKSKKIVFFKKTSTRVPNCSNQGGYIQARKGKFNPDQKSIRGEELPTCFLYCSRPKRDSEQRRSDSAHKTCCKANCTHPDLFSRSPEDLLAYQRDLQGASLNAVNDRGGRPPAPLCSGVPPHRPTASKHRRVSPLFSSVSDQRRRSLPPTPHCPSKHPEKVHAKNRICSPFAVGGGLKSIASQIFIHNSFRNSYLKKIEKPLKYFRNSKVFQTNLLDS